MKKIFFQKHIGFWVCLFIELCFVSVGIFVLVGGINTRHVLLIISAIGFSCMFLWVIVCTAYYHITFLDEKIDISGELSYSGRTQYKDSLLYEDIKGINVIYANQNSQQQHTGLAIGSLRPKLFFEFVLKDGRAKWMYISFFSKRQKGKMLQIICEKTGLNLTYDTLLKQDLSYFRRRKKQ